MGVGGVMGAAAKVAGIGAFNGFPRGFPAMLPLESAVADAARKATRAVPAIVSSSENVLVASQYDKLEDSIQRPCWEIDYWEFAGGEKELIVQSAEPLPRLIFGGVPTIEEAKEATSELKDAVDKLYLSSPNLTESKDSFLTGQESGLSLHSNIDGLITNACVTSENYVTPAAPTNAVNAFRLLYESPAAQTVVASIACDRNVWDAMMGNPAVLEFLESQKTSDSCSDVTSVENKPPVEAESQDLQSAMKVKGFLENVKDTVVEVKDTVVEKVSNFSNYIQNLFGRPASVKSCPDAVVELKDTIVEKVSNFSNNIKNLFGGPASEKSCPDADENAKFTFVDETVGSGLMGLVIMVIMVVVLKRT